MNGALGSVIVGVKRHYQTKAQETKNDGVRSGARSRLYANHHNAANESRSGNGETWNGSGKATGAGRNDDAIVETKKSHTGAKMSPKMKKIVFSAGTVGMVEKENGHLKKMGSGSDPVDETSIWIGTEIETGADGGNPGNGWRAKLPGPFAGVIGAESVCGTESKLLRFGVWGPARCPVHVPFESVDSAGPGTGGDGWQAESVEPSGDHWGGCMAASSSM